ncbi:E3 ubiquitin/ISG15 ligase TRIM25-like [Lampetra fluviatilis]
MAASKDQLENELTCPICFQYYRDPVILHCKHSFCRECILKTWEHGPSNCPHCRMSFFFMDRQEMEQKLEKNFQLANIVESFASLKLTTAAPKPAPKKKKSPKIVASLVPVPKDVPVNTPIMCDLCVGAKRQAVKTCQLCVFSMCQEHLEPHLVNEAFRHHILVKPCRPVKLRLCPEHREPLKMYCTQDNVCVCTVCCMAGKHRGHDITAIDEFATNKKKKLYSDLQNLNSAKATDIKKLDILKKTEENVKKASVEFKKKITSSLEAAVTELQAEHGRIQQLAQTEESHMLEKITGQISLREKSMDETLAINGEVQALMRHEDDIAFLEESQAMEERIKKAMKGQPEAKIVTKDLFANLKGSITEVTSQITEWKDRNQMLMSFRNIAVDSDTAHCHLEVAKDRKRLCLPRFQNRKEIADMPQRFSFWRQALSCESFTFGQHYWEVGVEESNEWAVGVAYSSLPRRGKGALIELGGNDKSWCLENNSGAVTVNHRADKTTLQINGNLKRIGVLLNCDGGTVAFYNVCLVKTHLHSFSTAFTEPVFAAFKVMSGALTMCSP